MFICPTLYGKYLFWANLVGRVNCLFKMKLDVFTNLCMLKMFISGGRKITCFGKFCQKIKIIWFLDYFKYADIDVDIQIFYFGWEVPFLGELGPKR